MNETQERFLKAIYGTADPDVIGQMKVPRYELNSVGKPCDMCSVVDAYLYSVPRGNELLSLCPSCAAAVLSESSNSR